MHNFDYLIKQVETKEDTEVYVSGSTSSTEIEKLESLIGIKLPSSFKAFLAKHGSCSIYDNCINGIKDNHATVECGGTVYYDRKTCREEHDLPKHLVVLQYEDYEYCYCLDSSKSESEGEYPVISYDCIKKKIDGVFAKNFNTYFKEFLEAWLED